MIADGNICIYIIYKDHLNGWCYGVSSVCSSSHNIFNGSILSFEVIHSLSLSNLAISVPTTVC